MNKIPNISESEWEVMKVMWKDSPQTANEIINKLTSVTEWSPKTIRTLIDRLVKKCVISYTKEKVYAYFPLFSESECLRKETQSFVQRLYGGAFKPLFVNFLQEEKLSKEDIAELKAILNEKADS